MSKTISRLKKAKQLSEKIDHGCRLKTNIGAGCAQASPPLGTQLGQISANVAEFCKDFNTRTADIRKGIPLPSRVTVNPDRSYELVIHNPPTTYFLKQAAGVQKGSPYPGKVVVGRVSLRHIYEIAKIKSQDPPLRHVDIKEICDMVIRTARKCGIEVVQRIDLEEYKVFLEEKKIEAENVKQELLEKKEAKLLRMS